MYRQNARPLPPEKFRIRLRDDALKHPFSKHDNKQIFLNDPTLFSNGVGKKKVNSVNKSQWNPEFISWSIDAGKEKSKKSIYQNDFCSLTAPKLLTGRQNVENKLISIYSTNFSHGEPKPETSKEIQSDNYNRYMSKQRAKTCVSQDRERLTVANCLVWYRPNSNASARTNKTDATNTIQDSIPPLNA